MTRKGKSKQDREKMIYRDNHFLFEKKNSIPLLG